MYVRHLPSKAKRRQPMCSLTHLISHFYFPALARERRRHLHQRALCQPSGRRRHQRASLDRWRLRPARQRGQHGRLCKVVRRHKPGRAHRRSGRVPPAHTQRRRHRRGHGALDSLLYPTAAQPRACGHRQQAASRCQPRPLRWAQHTGCRIRWRYVSLSCDDVVQANGPL